MFCIGDEPLGCAQKYLRGCGSALQAAIATLGASGKVADMDLDEVETTEKKIKKKDKKKRTAAEVEADIGNNCAVPTFLPPA